MSPRRQFSGCCGSGPRLAASVADCARSARPLAGRRRRRRARASAGRLESRAHEHRPSPSSSPGTPTPPELGRCGAVRARVRRAHGRCPPTRRRAWGSTTPTAPGVDVASTVDVLENDTGSPTRGRLTTAPQHGTVLVAGTEVAVNGEFGTGKNDTPVYQPDPGYTGQDFFAYEVLDANDPAQPHSGQRRSPCRSGGRRARTPGPSRGAPPRCSTAPADPASPSATATVTVPAGASDIVFDLCGGPGGAGTGSYGAQVAGGAGGETRAVLLPGTGSRLSEPLTLLVVAGGAGSSSGAPASGGGGASDGGGSGGGGSFVLQADAVLLAAGGGGGAGGPRSDCAGNGFCPPRCGRGGRGEPRGGPASRASAARAQRGARAARGTAARAQQRQGGSATDGSGAGGGGYRGGGAGSGGAGGGGGSGYVAPSLVPDGQVPSTTQGTRSSASAGAVPASPTSPRPPRPSSPARRSRRRRRSGCRSPPRCPPRRRRRPTSRSTGCPPA